MAPRQQESKRRRLRVTTGCLTCRRRHIKCDETRPTCSNCGKKNRTCRYGAPSQGQDRCTDTESIQTSPPPRHEHSEARETRVREPSENGGSTLSLASPTVVGDVTIEAATLESILLSSDYYLPADALQAAVQIHSPHAADAVALQPLQLHTDCPIQLSVTEVAIFRNYVEHVSHWVDSFSADQPFHRHVPILALTCRPLLDSCLAFAAKQMDLVGALVPIGLSSSEPVRYYRLALNAIRALLLHRDHARSDEVLAACILLSTYEMVDVAGDSLGSHLKGVASLLQARQVTGDATGIRGACYWTWYRHETWAALRTGRRMSLLDERYWRPQELESFAHLSPEEIANRVLFIFGQCISFCNDDSYNLGVSPSPGDGSRVWSELREGTALRLEQALHDWKAKLPLSMACFESLKGPGPMNSIDPSTGTIEAMWFVFPHSAVATQLYHASKLMLALKWCQQSHQPPGLANSSFLSQQRRIHYHREQILLTANSGIPDAWGLISTQCLYLAGLWEENECLVL
ncbi:hypothetical protein ASPVEDRAFT_151621 [Aspergillus versicolor CBS 583.65]|uniref:Zn(2)-C6 fungal-type domain-containing protein n=1 Tax=Aspergillus versicolor CBS 583.65 TaxID=1036611 RepID=A0A1L9PNH5_ASPVE|nr:uncharacterized protein ASPVEDRAFT_151621 [Aspergillus versicolor CBS 583.65]OJJ03053.1 hypothetical protein ASPVEDRAFT_151621 [Aspergillus versicolor CBS 583.65]